MSQNETFGITPATTPDSARCFTCKRPSKIKLYTIKIPRYKNPVEVCSHCMKFATTPESFSYIPYLKASNLRIMHYYQNESGSNQRYVLYGQIFYSETLSIKCLIWVRTKRAKNDLLTCSFGIIPYDESKVNYNYLKGLKPKQVIDLLTQMYYYSSSDSYIRKFPVYDLYVKAYSIKEFYKVMLRFLFRTYIRINSKKLDKSEMPIYKYNRVHKKFDKYKNICESNFKDNWVITEDGS